MSACNLVWQRSTHLSSQNSFSSSFTFHPDMFSVLYFKSVLTSTFTSLSRPSSWAFSMKFHIENHSDILPVSILWGCLQIIFIYFSFIYFYFMYLFCIYSFIILLIYYYINLPIHYFICLFTSEYIYFYIFSNPVSAVLHLLIVESL
jgi:hypothetical protein